MTSLCVGEIHIGDAGLGEKVRLLVFAAVVSTVLVVTASAGAESLRIKHKSWRAMTTQQKIVVLRKQIHKDKCILRFWKNHHQPVDRARIQTHWARVSLRIASHSLHRLERSMQTMAGSDMGAWMCIHRYEGSWSDPNSPYWGGLQMDMGFQKTYGSEFLNKYGTADHWPIIDQIIAARRARDGYGRYGARGYTPWPNTARLCGLL